MNADFDDTRPGQRSAAGSDATKELANKSLSFLILRFSCSLRILCGNPYASATEVRSVNDEDSRCMELS